MTKVFQWASGTVGRHAARAAANRCELELVGLHVRSADKVGRDIGELIGADNLGIAATSDIAQVAASAADVVIHAPLPSMVYGDNPNQDLDDICALLEAGKNVITVVGYMYPAVYGPELVARLERACATGQSTFHSTGLNPGWMGDLLPLTMSALLERVDRIHVLEISDFQGYPSPEIMFKSMGFNSEPEVFQRSNARRANWLNGLFSESVQMVADGIGLGVTEVASHMEIALAEADLETASGTVRAGTVAGQHWRWSGLTAQGDERVVHETVWRMHHTVAPQWATGGHQIHVSGRPEMKLEIAADYISDGLLGTAMHAVNAIPYVVAAEPGIKTFLDLPWMMARQ